MSHQFAFLFADDSGNLKAADRKLIRSHCMKGINVRENSRRSLRQTRKERARQQDLSIDGPSTSGGAGESSSGALQVRESGAPSTQSHPRGDDYMSAPRPSPLNLSVLGFPGNLDSSCGELTFKYMTYDTIRHALHPMIHCIDFNLKPRVTLEWFASDIAFFHSVLLTTAAVDDFIHRRLPSRRTRLHLQRTLSLLNGRLSEADPHMVESTFFIVLNLAFVASMLGDREAVSAHMDGLWRIIRLRGAVHPRNNVKILHLDLWRALMTDGKPGWYRSPVSWRPLYQAPPRKSRTGINSLVEELDVPRLTGVFYDLQALSNSINDASEGGAHLDGAAYDSSVRSIQDRLLHLENDISSPLAHAVRLGMLAFMTTMMRIPGGKIPLTYMYGKLRSTCLGLDVSTPERRCIGFWLLMVGGVSVFEADEPWLRARWEDVAEADLGWDEARSKLREVMWISTLHDDLGRRVFAQVARQ